MIANKDASCCFNTVLVRSGKGVRTLMTTVAERTLELEKACTLKYSAIYSSSCPFSSVQWLPLKEYNVRSSS